MIIKTIRHVYVLIQEGSEEEYTTVIGVFTDYEKAMEAKQRLEAVSSFDDYFTVRSTAFDDFTYVEQEEERYAEVTCDDEELV